MAIQTLHDVGEEHKVSPKMDGGIYQRFKDCVCAGIGDEMTISYNVNSLVVQFNAGSQAVIGGAYFRVMELEAITLEANSVIYLCANIDLSRPNGSTGAFVQRTSSNMQSDNLNGNGTSRDLLLYVITTGASGVTDVQDRRVILGNENSINGYAIQLISEADYEALDPKDPNTIYYTFEA